MKRRTHPHATVTGLYLAASVLTLAFGCQGPCRSPASPHIVLITIDTLRADHLGMYGYERKTAPALASLAREGVLFENAVSQAPWTLPSLASIHTSLYPSQHGAIGPLSPFDAQYPTVGEVLHDRGYRTLAVINHPLVGRRYGFARGIDVFDETLRSWQAKTSQELTEVALRRFAEDPNRKTFLWVHYFDPHFPYLHHSEFSFDEGYSGRFREKIPMKVINKHSELDPPLQPSELDHVINLYDEEIAFTDRWIGDLVREIREAAAGRPVVFVVASDHGDYFLERGRFGHDLDVYRELIHVPLVISGAIDPSLHGRRVAAPVENASIPATLMTLAGISSHPFRGPDLLAVARGARGPRYAISEGSHPRGNDQRKRAVISESWKLIHNLDSDSYELYDLSADRNERHDLASRPDLQAIKTELVSVLDALALPDRDAIPKVDLTKEALERLIALGYLGDSK